MSGGYDDEEGFTRLDKEISEHEMSRNSSEGSARRLFYLALPPSVYPSVCKMIRKCCTNKCKSLFLLFFYAGVTIASLLIFEIKIGFIYLFIMTVLVMKVKKKLSSIADF